MANNILGCSCCIQEAMSRIESSSMYLEFEIQSGGCSFACLCWIIHKVANCRGSVKKTRHNAVKRDEDDDEDDD